MSLEKAITQVTLTADTVDDQYCSEWLKGQVKNLFAENARLREALEKCLPIVEAAFWDQHTAGMLPGSGYNHKAENLAGREWGWRESETFQSWLASVKK